MKNTTRIFKYDAIRAFAILTVLVAHIFTSFADTPLEIEIKEYFNTMVRFSTALFIFLAGFFFRHRKDTAYLKEKLRKVLIPYTAISVPATAVVMAQEDWGFSTHYIEIILSYILGYKFGFYFIFLIVMMYFLGFILVKTNLVHHMKKLLITAAILQLTWMAIDEAVYRYFDLYNHYFFQFRWNDLIFYRNPLGWVFFFILGMWYQSDSAKKLVSTYTRAIQGSFVASFLVYNLMIFFNYGDYTPHGSIIWMLFTTLLILALFTFNYGKLPLKNYSRYLSQKSYSIYLIHYFFIYGLFAIEKQLSINFPYISTLLIFPTVLLLSSLVIKLVKRVFGKHAVYLIGS